jgi:hypothetical protein
MRVLAEMISEARKDKQEAKLLFSQGKIKKEEADHRIGNASQVILFAETAIQRERTKNREQLLRDN